MIRIRLMRTGRRNRPSYRIVVADSRTKRDGKTIDTLGFYNPLTEPKAIEIDQKRYNNWISKGAQPTKTVARLMSRKS